MTAPTHAAEIAAGERFAFGANWSRFLAHLDDARIAAARESMQQLLGIERLDGKRMLDIGSGSGLFSLAARQLGATVVSFDFDPQSVACTAELRRRYDAGSGDAAWRVLEGSVLDEPFLAGLGTFDVVYSWGVLHHTGQMWRAIDLAAARVAPGGRFALAIYNDQGGASRRWALLKRLYVRSPAPLRIALVLAVGFGFWSRHAISRLVRLRNPFARAPRTRGMSAWHDLVDWVGGWPFEVATPDATFDFLRARGFTLHRLRTAGGGHACNEFVFCKESTP